MLAPTVQTYQEKMDAVMTMLEEGIKEVFSSGKYQEYLSMMAKFHNYSFRNSLLIIMQKPDASYVAGFHAWHNEFGRSVNKGEKAIKILAPYSQKRKIYTDKKDSSGQIIYDPKTRKPLKELQEITVKSFKIVYVFDASQTSGKPLPEFVSELKSHIENADDYEKAIRAVADCPIEFKDITTGSKGYFNPVDNNIVIKQGMASMQTIKTMIHELVHSRLHKDSSEKKSRATMEVEAESIAFAVLQFLGINTSDYSFAYLASWSSNQELKELSASLSTIQKETNEIIQLLTKEMDKESI